MEKFKQWLSFFFSYNLITEIEYKELTNRIMKDIIVK